MFQSTKKCLTLAVMMLFTLIAYAFEDGQTVKIVKGGKSLLVENSSLDAGKNVLLWTETNTNSQRWILKETGRGTFYIVNAYTDLYLGGVSAAGNNAVIGQIVRSNATSRGAWEIVPIEGDEQHFNIFIGTARRYALSSEEEIQEGGAVKLITASTADPERIKWSVEAVEPMEQAFTTDKRDAMMEAFKKRHYKKQSSGYSIDNGGFWGDAEMFETILDAYETTGDNQYVTMFDNLYTNFITRTGSDWTKNGQGWPRSNEYNDDIAWICIACTRGYLLTGTTKYLTTAKSNFNKMYQRADCYGNGLLQWKYGDNNTSEGTNACINGPAVVCACYLAIATADMSYYDKAIRTYNAHRNLLFEKSNGNVTGKVFDSGNAVKKTVGNTWASTYNQGTSLGAAIMLYNYTGDEMYKKDADAINTWSKKNLANSHGIVHVCQTVAGDLCGFKGILMRYLRMYAEALGHPENYEWMAKNAYHAWNNRNSGGITSSAWLNKAEENYKHQEGDNLKTFEAFGNSTCLSAAFNAHLGALNNRDAYEKMEIEQFNFIRNANVVTNGSDEDGSGVTENMKNNNCIGYRNVDFGDKAASHIDLRAFINRTTTKVNVYMDAPDTKTGTLLCTVTSTDGAGISTWDTFSKPLLQPVTGYHNIYFVVTGTSGANLATLNWFRFRSENTIFGDMTNNAGVVTSSLSDVDDYSALIDDDVETGMIGTIQDESDVWIQYQSVAPVLLQGYSLNSGLTADNPLGWQLLGSNDGENWTLLHEQSDTVMTVMSQRFGYNLDCKERYTHFRLKMKVAEGQQKLSFAEWQLLGNGISPFDITADGGTITEGMEALIDHVGNTTTASPLTAVYKSNGNYLLKSYSITALDDDAPKAWTLEGSTNGTTWKAIDSRSDVEYPYTGSSIVCNVNSSIPYIYYRLKIKDEETGISQWQLYGNLDFGSFYADIASVSTITASDNSLTDALTDKDGATEATISGEDMCWNIDVPVPVKPIGMSLLCGRSPDEDPKDIVLRGIEEDGTITDISTRSLTFPARGSRLTNTISSTKVFKRFLLQVNSTTGSTGKASLADFQLYGTVVLTSDDDALCDASSIETTVESTVSTESIDRINDKSRTSRYSAEFKDPIAITYNFDEKAKVNAYGITASKDNVNNDPASWMLEGSNDGEEWTVLDTRSNELFSNRYATQIYQLNADAEYSKLRLTINEVNGGTKLMITELQYMYLKQDKTLVHSPKANLANASIKAMGEMLYVNTPSPTTLRIYTPSGKMVNAVPLHKGSSNISLPSESGIYIVIMQVDGKNIMQKVLK